MSDKKKDSIDQVAEGIAYTTKGIGFSVQDIANSPLCNPNYDEVVRVTGKLKEEDEEDIFAPSEYLCRIELTPQEIQAVNLAIRLYSARDDASEAWVDVMDVVYHKIRKVYGPAVVKKRPLKFSKIYK